MGDYVPYYIIRYEADEKSNGLVYKANLSLGQPGWIIFGSTIPRPLTLHLEYQIF